MGELRNKPAAVISRDKLHISTIAEDACTVAEKYDLGLEIAEYCTAYNMDEHFTEYDVIVREKMKSANNFVFHAAFNELCPAAIDPLVLEIAKRRFKQAMELSLSYGINRMVVHSGYIPLVYHKSWFEERSILFWREFFKDVPDEMVIFLENVMEDSPELLTNIVRGVGDPRFQMCLDVGHVNVISDVPYSEWIGCMAPYLAHVHIHNNYGKRDIHNSVGNGEIDMGGVLTQILEKCPEASYTVESIQAEESILWLIKNNLF